MSGGLSPKRKGDNGEREFCRLMGGERSFWQPNGGEERADVINVPYLGAGEVKRRKDGFRQLYAWLQGRDFVAVRADRKEWLVVMRAADVKLLCEQMDELKAQIYAGQAAEGGVR